MSKRVKDIQFKTESKQFSFANKLHKIFMSSKTALENFQFKISLYPAERTIQNEELANMIYYQGNNAENSSNEYMSLMQRIEELRKEDSPDLNELKRVTDRLNNVCASVGATHGPGSTYIEIGGSVFGMNAFIGL